MHFTDESHAPGVREQSFTLGDLPGVLWSPPEGESAQRPLIFMGHGGGQHKRAPGIVARAHRFVAEGGFAVVAVDVPNHGDRVMDVALDRVSQQISRRVGRGAEIGPLLAEFQAMVAERTVPEWRSVLDAFPQAGPVGYWGVSLGCGLGVPFVAAEPRVRAAVFGLGGGGHAEAARISVPVELLVQWDDERVPRESSLALFEAFGSAQKTLHANPGPHGGLPAFEMDSSLRFFQRHLN